MVRSFAARHGVLVGLLILVGLNATSAPGYSALPSVEASGSTGRSVDAADVLGDPQAQDALTDFVAEVRMKYSATFAEAGPAELHEDGDYYLMFTEQPDEALYEAVASQTTDTRVLTGAPASLLELEAIQEAAGGAFFASLGDGLVMSTRIVRFAEAVVVEFRRDAFSESEIASAMDQSRAAARSVTAGKDVSVPLRFIETDQATNFFLTDVKGGHGIRSPAGCTSGFTARNNTNDNLGVLSARHCQNGYALYDSAAGVVTFGKEVADQSPAGQRDAQFWVTLTTGNTTTKIFRGNNGNDFSVNTKNDPIDGADLCHYGITTDDSCGVVTDTSYCGTFRFPQTGVTEYVCGLTEFGGILLKGEGGDSGGPCYKGSNARGTLTGGSSGLFYTTQYCTEVSTIENYLNVTIRVQN